MVCAIDRLETYGYTNMPAEQCEAWPAKLNLDGSLELEHEYGSGLPPGSEYVYLSSGAELDASVKDAKESLKPPMGAMKLGIKVFGHAGLEPRPELLTLGDESYTSIVTSEGNPVGNIAFVRTGRIIHSLIIMGIYFDGQELLEDLFAEALDSSSVDKFGRK